MASANTLCARVEQLSEFSLAVEESHLDTSPQEISEEIIRLKIKMRQVETSSWMMSPWGTQVQSDHATQAIPKELTWGFQYEPAFPPCLCVRY